MIAEEHQFIWAYEAIGKQIRVADGLVWLTGAEGAGCSDFILSWVGGGGFWVRLWGEIGHERSINSG
jgi:hypothetical protein